MSESEFTSFNNTADNPWANAEMDVRNEAEETSKEVEKNEPSLANRIKNEMTLSEINELDIKNLPEDEYAAVKERIKYYRETGDAGPIKASANESVDTTEVNLPPKVQETKEKAAKHSGFNRFINNAAEVVKDPKKLAALGLTAMIATGAAIGGYQVGKSLNSNAETKPDKQIEEQEKAETEIGIKDGYGEKGMYLSENKPSELSFGSAVEVAEVCDGDECEMVKYTAENQVESMASYLANLPKELQPEGFKGLTIAETEQKLESLSDEEYEKVQQEFNNAIDQAFTRRIKVEGRRANVLMNKQDVSGDTNYENMKAVKCETTENAIMLQLFWTKDNNANSPEIGSMVLKIIYDDDGNIIGGCIQPLNELDSSVLDGLEEKHDTPKETGAPDNPDTPDTPDTPDNPTPEPTPPGGHPAKNEQAERDNAGSRVDQQPLNESKTPKTTIEQDRKPVQQAHEQVSSGNTAGSSAEKQKQSAVDNSEQTKQNNQESTSHANDSASERANDFAEGNY